ncbi:MAG TPA: MBL fold metallo-hydrolase [Methanobacteriaceae archaeon]|nr:MBL fold metallo-hydrolase [Methanobacteriaceae archaeon]
MPVESIKIIKQGSLILDTFETPESGLLALKLLSGVGGGSTVTYIKTDYNILVDTGFDYEIDSSPQNLVRNHQDLIYALERFSLTPDDIDLVFITHGHQDHYGNLELFPNAEVLSSIPLARKGPIISKGVKDGSSIADGVRVVYTPGHTFEHASLLLETKKMRYTMGTEGAGRVMGVRELEVAIAGDAVASSAHYAAKKSWNYNEDFISDQMALDSLKKIETADYIVPGHGNIFYNFLKPRSPGRS